MDQHIVELDSLRFPVFNYRHLPKDPITPANYFALGFGIYMIAAPMMGWIDYHSPTLASALCFGGLCEYLLGFYNWYEGRALQCFIDFVFGLLHLTIYFTSDLGKYSIPVPYEYHTYMQGTFYSIWVALLLVLVLSMSGRGCFYILDFFLLTFGCLFALIWHFSKTTWSRKTSGNILFVAAIWLWLTGLMRFTNGMLKRPAATCVTPYP